KLFKEKFRVGAGAGPANLFRGMIDGVHIYGRVLSDEEIGGLALDENITAIAQRSAAARTDLETHVLRWYSLEYASEPALPDAWKRLTTLRIETETLARPFP